MKRPAIMAVFSKVFIYNKSGEIKAFSFITVSMFMPGVSYSIYCKLNPFNRENYVKLLKSVVTTVIHNSNNFTIHKY
jgi:hypothetical protein